MIVLDQLKDDFNLFLKNNALWIVIVLISIVLIVLVLLLVLNLNKKKNKKPQVKIAAQSEWLTALGGKENIKSSEAYGSRLVVVLNDKSLMDKEKLKQLGVTNFIEMSDKTTLLLEDKAELVKAELDK